MTTRFENGIVVTLGEKNRVLWNAHGVVTDGELIAAVGDSAELKHRFPGGRCRGLLRARLSCPASSAPTTTFYSTMARGMAIPGEPAANFVQILERLWWKVDRALDEEDITPLRPTAADRLHSQWNDDRHRPPRLSFHARWLARPDRNGRPAGRYPRLAML